jgi:hypothetical protein
MRSVCCRGLVFLLILFGVACDNDPVSQVSEVDFTLSFRAISGFARHYAVWDMVEVTRDDQGGGGQVYLWCEDYSFAPNTDPVANSTAWPYGVEIRLIRAGSTEIEFLSSPAALNDVNIADYADNFPLVGLTIDKDPVTVDARTFTFSNPRVMTGAAESIMLASYNPLASLMTTGLGEGLCSNGNPGPSQIDGNLQVFNVTLNKGDTLVVKATLADDPGSANGLGDLFNPATNYPGSLLGKLLLDGQDISADVTGSIQGDSISFSYTSR